MANPKVEPGFPIGSMRNAKISVTEDNQGVGEALVTLLKQHHYAAELVASIPEDSDYIICLEGVNKITTVDEALALNKCIFKHAQSVAQLGTKKKTFLSVHDTGGYFGIKNSNHLRAWAGGVPGLIKTASKEWSDSICKTIDLEMDSLTAAEAGDKIFQELLQGGTEMEVGLPACGDRIVPQLISNYIQSGSTQGLEDNMRILVTGGGSGITSACLIELARKIKMRVAICGRTVLADEPDEFSNAVSKTELRKLLIESSKNNNANLTPMQIEDRLNNIVRDRKIRQILSTMHELGSEAIYLPIDIKDNQQLTAGVDKMRHLWGGIDGFIHGAGVIADKSIQDKTEEQFDQVLTTKVIGLKNLLNATKQDKLKLICLFSSESAISGNAGQADYAMANDVLNNVAHAEYAQRAAVCLVKSINWGPWELGMVNESLKQKFIKDGVSLLSEKDGSAHFARELLFGDPKQVAVLVGGGLEKARNN